MLGLASAQPAKGDSEVLILGEEGMLLHVDGKPIGSLPLRQPLLLPPGAHRFQLDAKNRRYESDLLTIPEGRAVEINLTRGTKGTAIAILTLRPMVYLAIRGEALDDSLRQALQRAAQEGVHAEHAALVSAEAESKNGAALACGISLDCLLSSAVQLDAKMILQLSVPALLPAEKGGSRCGLSGEIFDVGTGQSMTRADAEPACLVGEDQVLAATIQLTRRLLREAGGVGKGMLVVTSQPMGARVTVDNRPRGITPWQGASLPGPREVKVDLDGYQPVREPIQVRAGQTLKLPLTLVAVVKPPAPALSMKPAPALSMKPAPALSMKPAPTPAATTRAPRPLWRLAVGGALLGLGALSAGFGIGGLAVANQPVDPTCNCEYGTTGIGAGLLTVGILAVAGGSSLIAVPGPRDKQSPRVSP